MLQFWSIAIPMALIAGAIILVPLWRQRPHETVSQDDIDTRIFRERLTELDKDLGEGRIPEPQYRQLREELERTLLSDVSRDGQPPARENRLSLALAMVLALAVPLFALGYYYTSAYRGEAQDWMALQARLQDAVVQAIHDPTQLPEEARGDLPGFARVLQARVLEEGMSNPDSLYLLGITYVQLQHFRGALEALGRAYELNPQSPELRVAYAQAMILTQDPHLSQSGAKLLHGVLETNPHHQGALMLLGFSAFNGQNYGEAIEIWRRLLAMRDPGGEGAQLLRNSIARAEELRTEQGSTEPPATEPAAPTPSITVTVDLAPELRARLAPEDILFVFAKAANGPPMPLAAVRQSAEGFPVRVVLNDSQAMVPAMKLSNFQQVVVGARVSKGGGVTAEVGDLEAVSASLNLDEGSRTIPLTIDQIVRE